jgi:transposase
MASASHPWSSEADNIPPAAQFIGSPYDLEAHDARKHTTQWVATKDI